MKPSVEAVRRWVSLGGSLAVVSAASSVEPLATTVPVMVVTSEAKIPSGLAAAAAAAATTTTPTIPETTDDPVPKFGGVRDRIRIQRHIPNQNQNQNPIQNPIQNQNEHLSVGVDEAQNELTNDNTLQEPSEPLFLEVVPPESFYDHSSSDQSPKTTEKTIRSRTLERCHPDLGILSRCTQPGESCVAVSRDEHGEAHHHALSSINNDIQYNWYCLPHPTDEDDSAMSHTTLLYGDSEKLSTSESRRRKLLFQQQQQQQQQWSSPDNDNSNKPHRALQTNTITPSSFSVLPAAGGANEIYDFCKQVFTYDAKSKPLKEDPSSYDVCICKGYDNALPDPKYADDGYCAQNVLVSFCNKYYAVADDDASEVVNDACICTLTTGVHPTKSVSDPSFCQNLPETFCASREPESPTRTCRCLVFLEEDQCASTEAPTTASTTAGTSTNTSSSSSNPPTGAPTLAPVPIPVPVLTEAPTVAPIPAPTEAPTVASVPLEAPSDAPPSPSGDATTGEPTPDVPVVPAEPENGGFQATNIRQPTVPLESSSSSSASAAASTVSSVSWNPLAAATICAVAGSLLGAFVV